MSRRRISCPRTTREATAWTQLWILERRALRTVAVLRFLAAPEWAGGALDKPRERLSSQPLEQSEGFYRQRLESLPDLRYESPARNPWEEVAPWLAPAPRMPDPVFCQSYRMDGVVYTNCQ